MFGNYAISQTPITGRNGVFYPLSRNENITVTEDFPATSTFVQSLTEDSTAADSLTINAQFACTDSENIIMADINGVDVGVSLNENFTLSAADAYPHVWAAIQDAQIPGWTPINVNQPE